MESMHTKWTKLLIMAIFSFVAMYVLMYMMVDTYENVYANLNQLYMATVMTGGMMLIEIALMRSMYDRKTIIVTAVMSAIFLIVPLLFLRGQVAISDKEFLKSMIPHHGAAVLMCKNAKLEDLEIKRLCNGILAGQQSEIEWMQAKLSTFK